MRLSTRQTACALFVFVSLVYQFPLAYNLLYKPFFNWAPGIDVASTTLIPLSLLQRGDFALDQFRDFAKQNYRDAYFIADVNDRAVSRYPIVAAVLALPLYGVPVGTGWMANSGYPWLLYPWTAFMVAKFGAALMAALAVLMFFFCARELTGLRSSAALALVCAFGTSVWSTASQGLWQQTPSILLQLIGIWFILRGRRKGAMSVAPGALFFSAATVARQNDALSALLFTLYVFFEHRAALWRWFVWAIPPLLLAIVYNAAYNGSPLVFGYQEGLQQTMGLPRPDGILGLFISPSRGLLVYSPFFMFTLPGWRSSQSSDKRFFLFSALVFASNVLLLSSFQAWDGGWGYGTRLITDALPYAMFLLIPALTFLRGGLRRVFWGMVAYAVILQSFGLWDYGVRWHWHWENWAYNVWDIGRSEPLFYAKEYTAMARYFLTR